MDSWSHRNLDGQGGKESSLRRSTPCRSVQLRSWKKEGVRKRRCTYIYVQL